MSYGRPTSRKSTTGGQHSFAQIPRAEIPRSQFNRSCGLKTTFSAGELIPIFCDEALPGDTMNLTLSTFARMATPLYPVMDNQALDFFFFYVPNRLLWDNWEKFNGAQDDPGDSTDFTIPEIVAPDPFGVQDQTISDYMGIPVSVTNITFNALWHRAYNLIYNEWFRDENLVDSLIINRGDGPDTYTDYAIVKRGKRKDYFTGCLPWPQKGVAVTLPLGTTAPVIGAGSPEFIPAGGSGGSSAKLEAQTDDHVVFGGAATTKENLDWFDTKLTADLTNATAATINQLREAFAVQRLYERDARGGTRYTEILHAHFGVTSPDHRLQRPEYLGGGTQSISVTPVASTNPAGSANLGDLGGFGIATGSGIGFNKSFTEHGVILGLVASRADLNYQQGLPRMFSRQSRWDFFWPALANLGEQAVLNKEIFANDDANDDLVFGYQERFAEYRYKASQTTAQMRSTNAIPLDQWHLAQDFATLPVLNASFIEEDPPLDRVLAVSGDTQFLMDCFFEYRCARPMPTYSVPGMIDHF